LPDETTEEPWKGLAGHDRERPGKLKSMFTLFSRFLGSQDSPRFWAKGMHLCIFEMFFIEVCKFDQLIDF